MGLSHLLSGAKQDWQTDTRHQQVANLSGERRKEYLHKEEQKIFDSIPENIKNGDARQLFWWLWRCLPAQTCKLFDDPSLLLMPAETRLPDGSIWSHSSMTSALAGALIGYDTTMAEFQSIESTQLYYKAHSHPYLVSFTFTPVQELIKASRKMRDFWAGSWILHYVSAHISWKLAQKYGPDSLLYPSLFNQPPIDKWLLEEYPDFKSWIGSPSIDSLLTAGFPNVLVLVLPKAKVAAAMRFAEQELKTVWQTLGNDVFNKLGESDWLRGLEQDSPTWDGWLNTQWQTYWTGVPIGVEGEGLKSAKILEQPSAENFRFAQGWADKLNQQYGLDVDDSKDESKSRKLFQDEEIILLRAIYASKDRKFSANIGSWWGYIFDTARINLGAVKNARTWQLPTVFSTRSSVSGIGAAVYPKGKDDWACETDVKEYWKNHANLFNGSEQLNATEVIKRGLHQILPDLLGVKQKELVLAYPDLTSGVAGYLNTHDEEKRDRYIKACIEVQKDLPDNNSDRKWGIPWAEAQPKLKEYPPRLINASWLVDDLNLATADIPSQRTKLEQIIKQHYPNNNPTDWYVLAAGDGDGMSDWLKGINMENYREYIPKTLADKRKPGSQFDKFLDIPKRMGPATHNALSRALLDFSNRLLPYLTQQRYAGRLIYGGGDDVLAYTNLWEWDKWVWDVRQCFRGAKDEGKEFDNTGDYWRWNKQEKLPEGLTERPLFTMGQKATISFGITIAHQSTPMAIALEQLWEAEASAKEHLAPAIFCQIPDVTLEKKKKKDSKYSKETPKQAKDAIEIRAIYSNGNILKATAKFDAFRVWQNFVEHNQDLGDAIFEQAALLWDKHPAPTWDAIEPWCRAFVERRKIFEGNDEQKDLFCGDLQQFIRIIYQLNLPDDRDYIDEQIGNWLKLAAFTIRRREIKLGGAA